jgi:hypothetical protein
MKPESESQAWSQLHACACAKIRPDFADRVLRASRSRAEAMPSVFSQILLGAATAAACVMLVVVVHARSTQSDDNRALADWQQLSSAAADLDQAQ